MRTRLIQLYGAPSSGKSVKMLQLAVHAKLLGHFCEISPEVAKEYVVRHIKIDAAIQYEITREQRRRFFHYLGSVDTLITDAPLLIGAFYAHDNGYPEAATILREFQTYQNEIQSLADIVNVYVTRRHPFVPHGRYQPETHAMKIEHDMLAFVQRHHNPAHLIQVESTADVPALWNTLQTAPIEPQPIEPRPSGPRP